MTENPNLPNFTPDPMQPSVPEFPQVTPEPTPLPGFTPDPPREPDPVQPDVDPPVFEQ